MSCAFNIRTQTLLAMRETPFLNMLTAFNRQGTVRPIFDTYFIEIA